MGVTGAVAYKTSGRRRRRLARLAATVRMPKNQVALSLFWRTFFLLAVLLAGGVFAWTQTFRALEFEPRAAQAAQQIASLVNLARACSRAWTASTGSLW